MMPKAADSSRRDSSENLVSFRAERRSLTIILKSAVSVL